MKLDSFVKQFNKITDDAERSEFLKKHLKRKYVPFIERNNAARRTVEATHVFDGKYIQNTQLLRMFEALDFIELYTDIEFDRIVDGVAVSAEVYDKLMSNGIVDAFMNLLSFDEIEIWENTYDDYLDDLKDRLTSPAAIINDIALRSKNVYEVLDQWVTEVVDSYIHQNNIEDNISEISK